MGRKHKRPSKLYKHWLPRLFACLQGRKNTALFCSIELELSYLYFPFNTSDF